MIPYSYNPTGRSKLKWRNFYDHPITWTDFNSIDFSSYSSVRFEIDFTTLETNRATANNPIFGPWGGGASIIYLSRSGVGAFLAYTFTNEGRYKFLSNLPLSINSHTIIYTMTPGEQGTLYLDGIEKLAPVGNLSGYPNNGNNKSEADCTIQRIELYGDNNLIWKAKLSDLTI